MDPDLKTSLLNSKLFSQIDDTTLAELYPSLEQVNLTRGDTIFNQGDNGDAFYFLVSGRLAVIKQVGKQQQQIGELRSGDSFGELALISDQPRAATIKAIRDSELARLPKSQFQQIINRHPKLGVELLKILGERLNQQEHQVHTKCQLITLVTLTKTPITQQLSVALKQHHTVDHLTPKQLDQQLWQGASEELTQQQTTRHEKLSRWLSTHESAYDYILLETTTEPSIWRDFCLRQADKILYLVDTSQSPHTLYQQLEQHDAQQALNVNEVENQLVLIHPSDAQTPRNTSDWLQHNAISQHHHIRQQNQNDIERLARELCGKSIALVLGGGGARSFAQIGVIKAMQTLGIPIDKIAGTSMGAIIAAQYAAGNSPEQVLAINEESWVKQKPHRDFTIPVSSLLSANRAKKLTRAVFDDREIADLWINFFCISTDLTNLTTKEHNQGTIWPALLASGAIPSVCSSIISDDGALLVDGGIIDNLPVAAMRAKHQGPIIAVDVSSDKGLNANVTGPIPPNGWRALLDYINPWAKSRRFPHLFKIITHTATLASKINAEQSRKLADLCLTPNCEGHGLMEMKNLDRLVEQGYQQALPELKQWFLF